MWEFFFVVLTKLIEHVCMYLCSAWAVGMYNGSRDAGAFIQFFFLSLSLSLSLSLYFALSLFLYLSLYLSLPNYLYLTHTLSHPLSLNSFSTSMQPSALAQNCRYGRGKMGVADIMDPVDTHRKKVESLLSCEIREGFLASML
jgi:hypothetical protein